MYALSSIITHVPISANVLFSEAFFQPWMINGLYTKEVDQHGEVTVRPYADRAILFRDHLILIDVYQNLMDSFDPRSDDKKERWLERYQLSLWKTRRLWSKLDQYRQGDMLYMDKDCLHKLPETVQKITKICLTLAFIRHDENEFFSIPHAHSSIYQDDFFELNQDENPILMYSFHDFAEIMAQLKNLPELLGFLNYHKHVICDRPDFGATSEIGLIEQYYADRSDYVPSIDYRSVEADQFQSPWSVQSLPPNTAIQADTVYSRLPYQIDRPDLQDWAQRGTSGIIFALFLIIWLYIALPILSVFAWLLGALRFKYFAVDQYHEHLDDLQFCLLLIGIGGLIFVVWALFFRLLSKTRWARSEKKAAKPENQLRISRQEMMRYFEISNLNVHVARNEKICVFNFDEQGRILDIQGRAVPTLQEVPLTLEQKVADFSKLVIESAVCGEISNEEAAQKIAAYAQSLGQS